MKGPNIPRCFVLSVVGVLFVKVASVYSTYFAFLYIVPMVVLERFVYVFALFENINSEGVNTYSRNPRKRTYF